MPQGSWYTIDEARDDWSGAPLDDDQLQLVLDVSQHECVTYSPVPLAGYLPLTGSYGTTGTYEFTRTGDVVTLTVMPDVTEGMSGTPMPERYWPTMFQIIARNTSAQVLVQTLAGQGLVQVNRFPTFPAAELVMEYVAMPAVPDTGGEIPDGHRWAHLAHARAIWNAQKVNPSGALGDDTQGFALTPFPLDWSIKQRLRPREIFGGSVG